MPLYVLKPKTENKNITQDLYDRNRKKCKSSLQVQKKSTQNQYSLYFFSREFIVSVSFSISTTFRLR